MKISKKLGIIFVVATIFMTGICIFIGVWVIDHVKIGEVSRAYGRVKSAYTVYKNSENEINNISKIINDSLSDIVYAKGLKDKTVKTEIEKRAKEILNSVINENGVSLIVADSKGNYYGNISEKYLLDKFLSEYKGKKNGTIELNGMGVIASIDKVKHTKNNEITYIVYRKTDGKFIRNLQTTAKKNINIAKNFAGTNENMLEVDGNKFYYKIDNNVIVGYLRIETLFEDRPIYIKLSENTNINVGSFVIVSAMVLLLIGVLILVNTIVFNIIKEKIIKRILNMNKKVNEIIETEDLSIDLEEDSSNDEIGYLTKDINKMIDKIKENTGKMEYLATYDTLTGILNRHKIMYLLKELVDKKEEFSIFFIDLDNFKRLNDILGHQVGDKVLCSVADALNIIKDDNINFGRLGGDEFIVIRRGENTREEIRELGKLILGVLTSVIKFNRLNFEVSASIGISYYPEHSYDLTSILKFADIAMYKAKEDGGNGFRIFSDEMLHEIEIQNDIKAALDKSEFKLFYQPVYDLRTDTITGGEALIRWFRNDSMISPNEFIPLAKKSGDIINIDKFVLDNGLKYVSNINKDKGEKLHISINLSYKFLRQEDFLDILKRTIEDYGVEYKNLRIEITEDEFIDDIDGTIYVLNKVRELGITIALDDFGTGYSSFNYLQNLPVDIIKIDRSIVSKISSDRRSLNIVKTLIKLCHELGFVVVCEGVEYEEEFNILKEIKCDKIQGYYISKPVNEENFNEIIE